MIYLGVLFINVFLWYIAKETKYKSVSKGLLERYSEKEFELLALKIIFVILFLISAFRGYSVGTDTETYIGYCNWIKNDLSAINDIDVEIGYKVILLFTRWVGNARVLLVIVSAIICYGNYCIIKRYSKNTYFSTFLFITLYFFCMSMNVQRQAVAMVFIGFYVMSLYEKKKLKAVGYLALAVAFHKTAIVMLIVVPVVYALRHKRFRKVFENVWIICLTLLYLLVEPMVSLVVKIVPKYQYYIEREHYAMGMVQYEPVMYVFLVIIAIMQFVMLWNTLSNKESELVKKTEKQIVLKYDLITILVFGAILLICVSNNRMIGLISIGALFFYKLFNRGKKNVLYYHMALLTLYMVFLQAKMMIFGRLIWYPAMFLILGIPACTKNEKVVRVICGIAFLYFVKLLIGNSSEVLPYILSFQ